MLLPAVSLCRGRVIFYDAYCSRLPSSRYARLITVLSLHGYCCFVDLLCTVCVNVVITCVLVRVQVIIVYLNVFLLY